MDSKRQDLPRIWHRKRKQNYDVLWRCTWSPHREDHQREGGKSSHLVLTVGMRGRNTWMGFLGMCQDRNAVDDWRKSSLSQSLGHEECLNLSCTQWEAGALWRGRWSCGGSSEAEASWSPTWNCPLSSFVIQSKRGWAYPPSPAIRSSQAIAKTSADLPLNVPPTLPLRPWKSSAGVDFEVSVRTFSWRRWNFVKRKEKNFFFLLFFFLCASCWLKTMQMTAKDKVGYISHHFHSSWVEPIYFVLNEGAHKPKGSLGTGLRCEGKLKHNKTPRLMVCTRSIITRRMFPDRQVQVITQHIANLSVPQPFPRELGWCYAQQINLSRQYQKWRALAYCPTVQPS